MDGYKSPQRGVQVKRVLAMMLLMNDRGYPIGELAKRFSVTPRTIRRDMAVIEQIGAPLYTEKHIVGDDNFSDKNVWRLQRHWLQRFL